MTSKKNLGQFYTTNYDYILKEMKIPQDVVNIIEPFAGNGDLLEFLKNENSKYLLECYDIDPKKDWIVQRDTILYPPDFTDKFLLTNPPYLARNKSKDKISYDKYMVNDLYKCHIVEISRQKLRGGIIIIPLNFWCSMRKGDIILRKNFLEKYHIIRVNLFEQSVFDDTDYSVCSIQFSYNDLKNTKEISFHIYPSNKILCCKLSDDNNYTIGGEIYNLPQNKKYKIGRLIRGMEPSTDILLKCIDDNPTNRLGLSIQEEHFYDNTEHKSERSYATITIEPIISQEIQKKLVEDFNSFLDKNRKKYNSLFLSNYRENARKRISFELSFQIINYLLSEIEQNFHKNPLDNL